MATLNSMEEQLKKIGCNYRFWGRAELKELANLLLPNEIINHCVNGTYEGGFAMLCVTDQRLLLIDKKPMFLSLEDIRFDMISELDYNHRLLNASILICTPNKSLRFKAYNQARLRNLYIYVQQRVMDIRQHYMQQIQMNEELSHQPLQPQFNGSRPTAPQPIPATSFSSPQFSDQSFTTQPQPMAAPQQPSRRQMMVAPIISAYTRLPLMSKQRRFLGSSAIRSASRPKQMPLWQQ